MVLRTSGPPEPTSAVSGLGPSAETGADDVLAKYGAARAQEALFDVSGAAGGGYDEFVDAAGGVRPAW